MDKQFMIYVTIFASGLENFSLSNIFIALSWEYKNWKNGN